MTGENGTPETPDWTVDPHPDPFDMWIDSMTIDERRAMQKAANALVALNFDWYDIPANVILGGAGE